MGPSDVQGLYAELAKRAAELAKNKEEMADKTKAAAVKDLGDNLKALKKIADEQANLKKLVDGIASLSKDIDKLKAEYTKYINDSVKLGNAFNKLTPDPKGRPYFMVANFLAGSHPSLSLDMPGS